MTAEMVATVVLEGMAAEEGMVVPVVQVMAAMVVTEDPEEKEVREDKGVPVDMTGVTAGTVNIHRDSVVDTLLCEIK